ncbi:hypothetical protein F4V57_04490 [Acinetobacter qingfengensis]|uniref:Dimethylamine monooxygenase subunit DmmA-like C-terminal domain-containing protein n=1 Tax=Acinetobacter qingfengensis TaxID=1262585 RepID=A0A1E7REQ9_9GAMM|nr:dimethylamine monooxygenase subunit DmmA family protein [Acinetobacter qingfengensis]KAA8735020.1 hypothetical protein F4V57_04490 [Acinetobacter qingfengensis]OEY97742.1 hypothetical protein BJI46_08285 [Acinetobacter qingfengensis]
MQDAMSSTPQYTESSHGLLLASRYFIILQDEKSDSALELMDQYQANNNAKIIILANPEDALALHQLSQAFKQACIGTYAIVCGDEYFLWQIKNKLLDYGLVSAEILLIKTPSPNKQIYCVHCFHLFQSSADKFCDCPQCHTSLFIRSHFSERLGAYMAVCANAEQIEEQTT